jgi:hypothetical protein
LLGLLTIKKTYVTDLQSVERTHLSGRGGTNHYVYLIGIDQRVDVGFIGVRNSSTAIEFIEPISYYLKYRSPHPLTKWHSGWWTGNITGLFLLIISTRFFRITFDDEPEKEAG